MEEAHIGDNVENPSDVVDGLCARDIFTESMKQEVSNRGFVPAGERLEGGSYGPAG